jgi:hypothetical protein
MTLTVPFLTDVDTRAAVKGSRDPLGIQQIWSRLGRHVVGNLTTVTTSVRDFTTHIVGFWFAEQLAEDLGPGSELPVFLRWEQLAAYSRLHHNGDDRFRGIERVRRNLGESTRVTISSDLSHQILSNQKTYGLWGLYTMPGRASGLVDLGSPRLTPAAREFVESVCLPRLNEKDGATQSRILSILRNRTTPVDVDSSNGPSPGVAHLLERQLLATEQRFYRDHLLYGGPTDPTHGRQRQLAELLARRVEAAKEPDGTQPDFTWTQPLVADLIKEAEHQGESWIRLAFYLSRIRTAEAVVGPVSRLFSHLMGLEGKTVGFIAERLREQWGPSVRTVDPGAFLELRPDLDQSGAGFATTWIDLARHLAEGHYEDLVLRILHQNAAVMSARGGTSWIEIRDGRLRVRYREEQGRLACRDELATVWVFPYFLDSVRQMAAELGVD